MNIVGVSQKAIVINKEGRMLTLFRTETAPTRPNTWDLPGGDLDFGEDATKSVIREIQEETGLSVENVRPFDVESIINDNFTAKCVNNICTKIPENAVDSVCGNGICEGNEGKYGCDPLGEGPNPCVGYIFCPEDCA